MPTPTPTQQKERTTARKAQASASDRVKAQQNTLRKHARQPRRADASTFFEAARSVEIVDWLVKHQDAAAQVDWLAARVGDACEDALKASPGTHKRFADHFWCDVIASLVQVLDELLAQVDSLPRVVAKLTVPVISARTWQVVSKSRGESVGNAPTVRTRTRTFNTSTRSERDYKTELSDAIMEKIVENLVATILHGAIDGFDLTFDNLLLKLRILGILFCSDPYAHAVVWNHCVVLLLEQGLVVRTRNYLHDFLHLFQEPWQWKP